MTIRRLEQLYGVLKVLDAINMIGAGWTSDDTITNIMCEFQTDKDTAEDLHTIIYELEKYEKEIKEN